MDPTPELVANAASKARQVLPPIVRDLIATLGLPQDEATVAALGHEVARAFIEGANFGAAEFAAQCAEKGIHVGLELVWTEPPEA